MGIIDPRNRPRCPQGVMAVMIRAYFKWSGLDAAEEGTEEFKEGWQMLFDFWTEPWPIKPPKPYSAYFMRNWVHTALMYIEGEHYDMMEDWWWELMFDTFTYPEYQPNKENY